MLSLAGIVSGLADWFGPPSCAACGASLRKSWAAFCAPCAASVELVDQPFFLGPLQVVALGDYGGALATAVRHLKYDDRPDLARPLGDLLGQACVASQVVVDVIAPVPLHVTRLATRGYNQAGLLAVRVARALQTPVRCCALGRAEMASTQTSLGRTARRLHVTGAFAVRQPRNVRGKAVLLVDDVTTTGATLQSCATALLESGATAVTAAVVARTHLVTSPSESSPQECTVRGALEIGSDFDTGTADIGHKTNVRIAPRKR